MERGFLFCSSNPEVAIVNDVIVLKFGGTSVKSIVRIQHVAEIIAQRSVKEGAKCVVVVSAMGDTTDYLYKLAKQCSVHPDKRELDLLLSSGEQISISLLAIVLQQLGVKAKSFTGPQIGILTDTTHSSARIKDINAERIRKALTEYDVVVVAGFQGLSSEGEVTTLGRGGSDTSAVALAAACGASVCDIYTDVDGVYTADPNAITDAKLLSTVSYGEILEMARNGAQVLHPRAVELAQNYGLTVRVRNTFKPENEGTTIKGEETMELVRRASGVAVDANQGCIKLSGVPARLAVSRKITDILLEEGISVDAVSQNLEENPDYKTIQLDVRYADVDSLAKQIDKIREVAQAKSVKAETNLAKVSLIGSGLSSEPKLTRELIATLEDAGVEIKSLSSSEKRISCFVLREKAPRAAQALHKHYLAAEEPCLTAAV
jgi:aspartate kinase